MECPLSVLLFIGFIQLCYGGKIREAQFEQPEIRYLGSLLLIDPLDIKICASNITQRSGSFAPSPPSAVTPNPLTLGKPLSVTLQLDASPECQVTGSPQYAFFISFRTFQLNWIGNGPNGLYSVSIDEPMDMGNPQREPNMALVDYSEDKFKYIPQSEVQYLSGKSQSPNITLEIMIHNYGKSHEVIIDYVLVTYNVPSNTELANELVFCDTLQSHVPLEVYCYGTNLTHFTACPANCTDYFGYPTSASNFAPQSFSYGSCGRERQRAKCGETEYVSGRWGRQKTNFILSWDILAGIIAGSVVVFLVFPMTVLCVSYYRRKR